jgi:hypothetical protein
MEISPIGTAKMRDFLDKQQEMCRRKRRQYFTSVVLKVLACIGCADPLATSALAIIRVAVTGTCWTRGECVKGRGASTGLTAAHANFSTA